MAFIAALVQWPKIKETPYRYFVPFLLFIVVYEFGSIKNWFSINHRNLWATNISDIIFFLFNAAFLLGLLKTPSFKKLLSVAIVLSIVSSLINMAFFQGFWNLDTATMLLQYVILIILCCLYYFELMHYTLIPLSIIKLPGFWVNTGLLLFCIINFLFFASYAYMAYKNSYTYFLMFRAIANISIAILYSCLAIAFLSFRSRSASG
nr:hypothetical protein [uncultured Mucilaginibacter sp.]